MLETTFAVHAYTNAVSDPLGTQASGVEPKCDALAFQHSLHLARNVFILPADQAWSHLDNGNLAAEAAIHLRKLESYITAPYNEKVLRKMIQLHHAGVVE
jgi:hypothetical protein